MLTAKGTTPVFEIMSSAPVTVHATTTVSELIELFDRYDYNAIPVTDENNRLAGIVTKLDVLRIMRPRADFDLPATDVSAIEVGKIMRPGVINLEGDAPVAVAADLLVETGLRSIPVVHRGTDGLPELVGMVSRGDVLRGLRFAMRREA